ncbi:hypothetical protein ACSW0I_002603 [Vibrio fluvialis]
MALAVILFKSLKATDHRILDNIDSEVYEYFMRSSYAAFVADLITSPEEALKQAIMSTYQSIDKWWESRLKKWNSEAQKQGEEHNLSVRIVQGVRNNGHSITGEVRLEELLPETVGMMFNTLMTTFYLSWEEQQETAIYILLPGAVKSWRRFEEILSRMNTIGEK